MSHEHFFEAKCLYNLNNCKLCMPQMGWIGLGWIGLDWVRSGWLGLAWLVWWVLALASEEFKQRLMNKRKEFLCSFALKMRHDNTWEPN
jgi:hypothetical protein